MTPGGGKVTLDAEEYLAFVDELAALERRMRARGLEGFNGLEKGKTTRPAKPKENDKPAAMAVDLDISGIQWKRSNRDGGGPAGPEAGWAWGFGYTRDGGILPGAVEIIQAIDRYGKIKVGRYVISMGGKDGTLLNRTVAK